MRTGLKLFRVKNHLTQQQVAERVGVSRQVYGKIEGGISRGNTNFWVTLQRVFNIPDEYMYSLMKCDS